MNFKEEYEALWVWRRQKTQDYLEACREEFLSGKNRGLDSELDAIRRQDNAEYNRRLVLLKVKYGRELDDMDKRLYDAIKVEESHRDDSSG